MGRSASTSKTTCRRLVALLLLTAACTDQGEAPEVPNWGPLGLAPPPPVVEYRPGEAGTSLEEQLISIVGGDATPLRAQSDETLDWAAVNFELPDDYHLRDVSVQALWAIDRPGSHIGGDWPSERRDGYEIRMRPDLSGAEQEVWIISDSHQIGVSLTPPPLSRVELSTDAASDLVQRIAIRLGNELA